jgi:hypothetical protein
MQKILEKLRADKDHPDDVKYVIIDWDIDGWEYEEVSIGSVENLLCDYEIEVESPDGFVQVEEFVNKGMWEQYVFVSARGDIVRCSNGHRFETDNGWVYAKDFPENSTLNVLHDDDKYYKSSCVKTNSVIPIVDITVNHENHRYYTNGVSSHNTGGGKSLIKCHLAATSLMFGRNVLYITMELPEEEVARRIDANLLDTRLDDLLVLPKEVYQSRVNKIKSKTPGKLIIKEYPTGSAHSGHFRHLLNELRLKKNFAPDIIFIDYLNICASSRVKGAASANSYTLVKSIAEEVRGLAMEFGVAIVTSSQFNRSAYDSSDVDLSNTSECIFKDEKVIKSDGSEIKISDLVPGDKIKTEDTSKIVTMVHHPKIKDCVKITTKSGKSIIVSKDHVFPVKGPDCVVSRLSVNEGMQVGFYLNTIK